MEHAGALCAVALIENQHIEGLLGGADWGRGLGVGPGSLLDALLALLVQCARRIAILTSERAQISDPRVRRLADEIVEARVRGINGMKQVIAELEL